MPGVFDGFSAKLAEKMGFKGGSIIGSGISESTLAYPDVGIMGLKENVDQARVLANRTTLLLTADADTGYGNAVNVYHTTQTFEQAGVAGITIEDQKWPKRCGHMEGKEVIDAEEMVYKIQAAVDAKKDPHFVIKVRTDAAKIMGIQEAVRRGNLYAEAGADLIFGDAILTLEDIELFVKNVAAPISINMGFGIRKRATTPLLSVKELEEMGVSVVTFPRLLSSASIRGMQLALEALKKSITEGRVIERNDLVVSFEELNDLMGLSEIMEMEKKYATNK